MHKVFINFIRIAFLNIKFKYLYKKLNVLTHGKKNYFIAIIILFWR